MAHGILGYRDIVADTPRSVAVCNTTKAAIVAVNLCNRNTQPMRVSIAITSAEDIIENLDYIEKDVEILPNCVLLRTGVAITTGQFITVNSNLDRMSAVVYGVEMGDALEVPYLLTPNP
tara:strand:+ start:1110 stop:1466 length:357 start_codon:yes stop_codon:yes gene_type:complete